MSLSSRSIIYTSSAVGTEPGLGRKIIRRRPALPAAFPALPSKETRICLGFCGQSPAWDRPRAVPAFDVTPIKGVGDPGDSLPAGRGHIMGTLGLHRVYGITRERVGWVWGVEPQQPQDLGQLLLPEMSPSASPVPRLVLGKS